MNAVTLVVWHEGEAEYRVVVERAKQDVRECLICTIEIRESDALGATRWTHVGSFCPKEGVDMPVAVPSNALVAIIRQLMSVAKLD